MSLLRAWARTSAGAAWTAQITDSLVDLLHRRRQSPGDGVITRMVMADEDGEVLTRDETLANVVLMDLPGHVTTVNLVGSGVVALLDHPAELAEIRGPSLVGAERGGGDAAVLGPGRFHRPPRAV